MISIQKKEWDSDFFGITIGAVYLDHDQEIGKNDLQNAGSDKFNLVYVFSDQLINIEPNAFRDCKIELECTFLEPAPNRAISIVPYDDKADFESLLSLAWQSGAYSRFKLDTKFGIEKFKLFYKRWLVNSINKEFAHEILVAYDENSMPEGFITLAIKDLYCEIGLLAVDHRARGKGVGKKLILASQYFAYKNGINKLRVATQERNSGAVGFYQTCGFQIFKRTNICHLWIKHTNDTIQ